jgi:hypothetical protein
VHSDDLGVALRERYLDRDGLPSPAAYARAHEIAPVPGSESFNWHVAFRFAYRSADAEHLPNAEPVYADCYFVRRWTYDAAFRGQAVWDGRVAPSNGQLTPMVYTPEGERIAGRVNELGEVQVLFASAYESQSAFTKSRPVRYNPFTGQLWQRFEGGTVVEEQRMHLPLEVVDPKGQVVLPNYRIVHEDGGQFALVARSNGEEITLARCVIRDADAARGEAAYSPVLGPGCTMAVDEPMVVFEVAGDLVADAVNTSGRELVLSKAMPQQEATVPEMQADGRFDEWRSVPGIADPQGDVVWYLDENPDTDLLEFKVVSDNEYLYFYTRVAGRHGNTAGDRDRYYFYVYIDADRNPATGYVPTRDDNCYYGVAIGDDCEAQFEFVDGRFVKTFFGFAGGSTEKDVLAGRVALAPSWYSKHDETGRLRDGYKVEYVNQGGEIKITEDFAEGTSDDIVIAISPDGSECEMRAALRGFLRSADGIPIIAAGQSIDLAAGVEASGQIRGNTKWGADSTAVIRGYRIGK